jgi:phage repressor protein C with HTH and peptisase S24 domain
MLSEVGYIAAMAGDTRLDRLQEAMADAGLDQTALAKRIGCTQGAISQILVGRTRRSKLLPDIARALGVPVEWLLGRSEDKTGGAAPVSNQAELETRYNVVFVPEVRDYSLGGGGAEVPIEQEVHSLVPLPRDWLRPMGQGGARQLFVTRGRGHSMEPTIGDGDIVIVDRAQVRIEQQDQIWALGYGGLGMMIKRLRRLTDGTYSIMSDNPSVAPYPPATADEIHLIGRVVWAGREM